MINDREEIDFDDSAWPAAVEVAPNDGSDARLNQVIEGIAPDAVWIWVADRSSEQAYCRWTPPGRLPYNKIYQLISIWD